MTHILTVNGKSFTLRGKAESHDGVLSMGSRDATTRLLQSMQPAHERDFFRGSVLFDGRRLSNFVLLVRPPRKVSTEG